MHDEQKVEARSALDESVAAERANFLAEGKIRIQMLLWDLLPCTTTLSEADEIGCSIFDEIDALWQKKHPDIDRR